MCGASWKTAMCGHRKRLCQTGQSRAISGNKLICLDGLEEEVWGRGFNDYYKWSTSLLLIFIGPFTILMVLDLWSFWNVCSSHYFFPLFEAVYLLQVASWALLIVPQRHLCEKADASSFLFRLATEPPAYNKWLFVVVSCCLQSSCCSCGESLELIEF